MTSDGDSETPPGSEPEPTQTAASPEPDSGLAVDDDDVELKIQGPIRRNAPLIIGILIVMVLGPGVSRMLSSYRGVVLRLDGDQMLVGFAERAPKNVDAIPAEDGDIVVKERMTWSPQVVPRVAGDHQLVALHRRFVRVYTGVIVLINPPKTPTGPHTAIIQLDNGKKLNVPLYGEHLATASVGAKVKKEPGMWEPYLLHEDGDDAPVGKTRDKPSEAPNKQPAAEPQDSYPASPKSGDGQPEREGGGP